MRTWRLFHGRKNREISWDFPPSVVSLDGLGWCKNPGSFLLGDHSQAVQWHNIHNRGGESFTGRWIPWYNGIQWPYPLGHGNVLCVHILGNLLYIIDTSFCINIVHSILCVYIYIYILYIYISPWELAVWNQGGWRLRNSSILYKPVFLTLPLLEGFWFYRGGLGAKLNLGGPCFI